MKRTKELSEKIPEIVRHYSKSENQKPLHNAKDSVYVINLTANRLEEYPCKSKTRGYFALDK